MRYRWPVFVVLGALLVAALVMGVLNRGADRQLLTPDAEHAPAVERRIWVAAFAEESAADELAALAAALPDGVPVLRLSPAEADKAGFAGEPGSQVRVAVVDRAGRPHGQHEIEPGSGDWNPVLDEVRFLQGFDRRPFRHAALNGTSALLLFVGFLCIRRRLVVGHVICMVGAGLITVGFLVSYLQYHYYAGSVPFRGEGTVRIAYFAILLSHTVLAALVAPLAGGVFYLAARRRFAAHRALARWTLPLWMYVSITGVLVYWMLYVVFAGPDG